MVILVSAVQSAKAFSPMLTTPFGMLMEVRELEPLNASLAISVIPLGKYTSITPLPLKHWLPIIFTGTSSIISGMRTLIEDPLYSVISIVERRNLRSADCKFATFSRL
jgi:hypothetical protein